MSSPGKDPVQVIKKKLGGLVVFYFFLLYVSFFVYICGVININTNQMKLLINLYLFAFGGYIVGHFINYFINL